MNSEFKDAGKGYDWLSWLGQPLLFDGGLCVNRTSEEIAEHNKHPEAKLMV